MKRGEEKAAPKDINDWTGFLVFNGSQRIFVLSSLSSLMKRVVD